MMLGAKLQEPRHLIVAPVVDLIARAAVFNADSQSVGEISRLDAVKVFLIASFDDLITRVGVVMLASDSGGLKQLNDGGARGC